MKDIKSTSYFNPSVIIIESSGMEFHFSKNMNKGIKYALEFDPKYIILSNDDVRPLETNWDFNLTKKLDENKLGYISPTLVNNRGNEVGPMIRLPSYNKVLLFTMFYSIIPRFAFPFIEKINNLSFDSEKKYRDNLNHMFYEIINSQPFSIFDSNLLNEIKGFDEHFENGCEDFDLSLRVYSRNFPIGLDQNTKFLDLGSATIGNGGFSILSNKTKKAEATQVKNWKTLIKKFGKMKYNSLVSENKNNIVFKI